MGDVSERIAALSPEKRELLLRVLQEKCKIDLSSTALPVIVPKPEERHLPFPLTDVQQAYWLGRSGLFDLGARGSNLYMEFEITRVPSLLKGVLQRLLETALQRLIERHEILRVIILPDGQQQILPHVPPYRVKFVDLRGRDSEGVETELERVRERMRTEKAPIDRWPLFEFLAHGLDGQRVLLHIRIDALLIDGTSRGMLLMELFQLLRNPFVSRPSPECSYRDYALTWAAFRDSQLYHRSHDYWQSRLPTLWPGPELPLSRNISPATPSRFTSWSLNLLDSQSYLRLTMRAARVGLSPSSVLTAAFVDTLASWSQTSQFSIGIISTYRPPIHPQIRDILGNFNTFYPLAIDTLSGTFKDRAQRVQQQIVMSLEHRYVSGFQVLRELNQSRGWNSRATLPVFFNSVIEYSHPSYQPMLEANPGKRVTASSRQDTHWRLLNRLHRLIQTLFGAFTRMGRGRIVSTPQVRDKETGLYAPQMLLASTVSMSEEGGLHCQWQAVRDVFPEGLMEDVANAYCRLLQRLADDEKSWQENWSETMRRLMPLEDLNQREAFNATGSPLPAETLHTLFAKQVPKRSRQAAVVTSCRTLTYEELYGLSNQMSRRLRQLEGQPNTLVAVVMEKGWEQVVAILGVLQAGAAYLPLDPELPSEHLVRLLELGEVKVALTQSWIREKLDWPCGVQPLCIDDDDPLDVENQSLDPVQRPDDLACVIYTSGSTGQPKGVMLDHRAVVNTILDINDRLGVGSKDRLLALSPLSSDLALYDVFGALAAGGTIVMPEARLAWEPAHWAELMSREQVTIWNSTPAPLERLVTHLEERSGFVPLSLRLALLSRDWIPVKLPSRLKDLIRDVQVISLGGSTEASLWSVFYPIERVEESGQSLPYGRPLGNQRVHVLNEALAPCPLWVTGHLYIAGSGLAQGYWQNEPASRANFIHHPRTGERLFRTGDMGRFLPHGYIELLGREADFQATLYGYPVTLRQVEATLEQHTALRAAVVLARDAERTAGKKRLVAYVVLNREPAPTQDDLRDFLKERLPYYMVPSAFVFLNALPWMSNGQVDRSALPVPESALSQPERAFVAPRDAMELELAEIWENVLERRPIGMRDNFFDLGGDSLKVVRLVNQIHRTFGARLSAATVFEAATIEQFANVLR